METTAVLHAQISCPCTRQVSTFFFPPFLLLAWVYYLYLQFPAPCSQDLSSVTPQILCRKSLLFNFSMYPSPVLLLRSGTVLVPQFLSPWHDTTSPFHGIARHTLPSKTQLRKSSILPPALTVEATPWKNNWGESPLSPSATSWRALIPPRKRSSCSAPNTAGMFSTPCAESIFKWVQWSSPSTSSLPRAHALSIAIKLYWREIQEDSQTISKRHTPITRWSQEKYLFPAPKHDATKVFLSIVKKIQIPR